MPIIPKIEISSIRLIDGILIENLDKFITEAKQAGATSIEVKEKNIRKRRTTIYTLTSYRNTTERERLESRKEQLEEELEVITNKLKPIKQ